MARLILNPGCHQRYEESARKYGEIYEAINGVSIRDGFCDGSCGLPIKTGDDVYAAVLLSSVTHENYERQKPFVWAHNFIVV